MTGYNQSQAACLRDTDQLPSVSRLQLCCGVPYFSGVCGHHTNSTSKNKENETADFNPDQVTLKDNTIVEVGREEPEKPKAGSRELMTTEAAGINKDGQPVQAAMEIGLTKLEDQYGKANVGTGGSKARTGKSEVEATSMEECK